MNPTVTLWAIPVLYGLWLLLTGGRTLRRRRHYRASRYRTLRSQGLSAEIVVRIVHAGIPVRVTCPTPAPPRPACAYHDLLGRPCTCQREKVGV